MSEVFVNRELELRELDLLSRKGGLLVVYGRRRVGKTSLLRHWLDAHDGLYTQAIEADAASQLAQVFEDLRARLSTTLEPKSWAELFEILALQPKRWTLCIDEFPYLAAVDATLPSRLQRFLDHSMPKGCSLILSGSSTRMMHGLFLDRAAPLYERARKLLHVRPMAYEAFCDARDRDAETMDSFELFSCVGGIPKYWEFVEPGQDAVQLADSAYFDFAPYMEQEPQRLLRDEGVAGLKALSLLQAVGRGAERPSEIAARLETPQTSLSRLFQQLIDASILVREFPFGESERATKRVRYRIQDPALRFWFHVFSPHQSLWRGYSTPVRRKLVHDHAATVFEDHCRARVPGARRFWERDVELDIVAPDPEDPRRLYVAEIKWRDLSAKERARVLRDLEHKWSTCSLAPEHSRVRFDVLDASRIRG